MRKVLLYVMVAAGTVAVPGQSQAQITPQIGIYLPGDDFESIRQGAEEVRVEKEGTLALGLNIELGSLRGSLAYASAAKLTQQGVTGRSEVGDGKVLAASVDYVLRPLPRLIVVQPYLLAGGGLRRANYSYDEDGLSNAFPKNDSDFALHAGLGADIKLGRVGISAEATSFISKNEDGDFSRHDMFALVGLKIGM